MKLVDSKAIIHNCTHKPRYFKFNCHINEGLVNNYILFKIFDVTNYSYDGIISFKYVIHIETEEKI